MRVNSIVDGVIGELIEGWEFQGCQSGFAGKVFKA